MIGLHEPLQRAGTPLATLGTVLRVVGFSLLVGSFTLRLALAYGHIAPEVTDTPELAVLVDGKTWR